jgi:7,8-dihydropterin-6-yl-methyl-4-(beta-D-ribofuranosyl)aminobenzene 5'-phosphate synthase
MNVKVLSENKALQRSLPASTDSAFILKQERTKYMFDTGASGLFAENAEKLGVDLREVDLAVISHGHYDHGGGLKTFLGINNRAKVYLHQRAFEKHYANRPGGVKAYIGLDESLLPNERFVFCDGRFKLDNELELFSGVKAERLVPSGNTDLFMKIGDALIQDDFAHEAEPDNKRKWKNSADCGL